jgi:hypothetical protein
LPPVCNVPASGDRQSQQWVAVHCSPVAGCERTDGLSKIQKPDQGRSTAGYSFGAVNQPLSTT